MDIILKNITTKYLCREKTVIELYNLIKDPTDYLPNAIYLYGHSGTGKTALATELLKNCGSKHCILNCTEFYTSKMLFEAIVNGLCDSDLSYQKCDDILSLIDIMDKNFNANSSYIICLDNAEKIREMDTNILPTFLRLQILTGLNICCIMIAKLPFEKYYPKTGLSEVFTIHCPQYSKNDIHKILFRDFEVAKSNVHSKLIVKNHHQTEYLKNLNVLEKLEEDFYGNYLNIFLNVFYRVCRDLPELRMISTDCFYTYCEPVMNSTIDCNDVMKLWRNISSHLKNALTLVYMRVDYSIKGKELADKCYEQSIKRFAQSLELPYYAKFLLISSFLASHNAPKADKKLFVKMSNKIKKNRKTIDANAKVQDKMSTSLGPKSFTIDRLLAIFYSIIDEKVGLSCNLLAQISTLVHLKFLTFVSGESNIVDGSARLQCTVGLQFIIDLGKVVGINVRQYLCDFM